MRSQFANSIFLTAFLCYGGLVIAQPTLRFSQPAEDYKKAESEPLPAPVEPLPDPHDGLEEVPFAPLEPGGPLNQLRLPQPMFDNRHEQPTGPLPLMEVLDSVDRHYPLLFAAMQERGIRSGEALSRWGAFDTKIEGYSMNAPMGFYKTYRHAVKVEKPTWQGGRVYSGYKLGDGNFEPWYGERETNEGGEFSAGLETPLWRGRPIDDRRTNLRVAQLERDLAEPEIYAKRIEYLRKATVIYWKWIASGQAYRITRDLLEIAELRDQALATRVKEGDVAPVERTDNRRVIAQRQGKLVAADRYFQQAAIDLSLFLRNELGDPLMPSAIRLADFPPLEAATLDQFAADVDTAMRLRPELAELNIARNQVEVELANARNQINPALDGAMWAAKDVGAPASSKGDKTPFQLEAGVMFDMPIERRKAYGKIRTSQAKIAQINAKQRYLRDSIVAEVQDAFSAIDASYQQWVRAHEALDFARQVEALERRNFELGNSTILIVQLREQATVDAALLEVEALFNYFAALADYRAALALPDPGRDGR